MDEIIEDIALLRSDKIKDWFLRMNNAPEKNRDCILLAVQLKAVFDRMVAKYETIRDKELYYIMTAAENDENTTDTALACMRGMADCIPRSMEMGFIAAKGVYEKGKVNDTPYMAEAYEMGKSVK